MHIIKSTKKSLIDDLSNILLELEFKSNHSIKSKMFTKLQKMKKTQSKIKPTKIGKRLGTTNCLGCKDFTHNFRLQEVKMTNKALREKSKCVVCWSNKSGFLKQKHKNKK